MRVISIFVVLFFTLTSCKSQIHKLTIYNRSSSSIDSVLSNKKTKLIDKIKVGDSVSININFSGENLQREGAFSLDIYSGKTTYNLGYALHDFGSIHPSDTFYVFDHGVNFKNIPPEKPDSIVLYIMDEMTPKADSISCFAASEITVKSTHFKLKVNFDEFQHRPYIKVFQQNKSFDIKVEINFEVWGIHEQFVYIYNNGETSRHKRN